MFCFFTYLWLTFVVVVEGTSWGDDCTQNSS